MKITMLTIGSTGDVRPYVLLGQELVSRGHQVTVAAFSRFRDMVLSAGLGFFPLSGDAEQMMAAIMDPNTTGISFLPRLEKSLRGVVPSLVRDMDASCKGADAMVCNFFGSVYYSVAEKHHIPCVQTQFFPMDPTRDHPLSVIRCQRLGPLLNLATYKLGYFLISTVEKRYLTAWRKENCVSLHQIRTGPDYRVGDHPIPVIYAVSPQVLPRPADWGPNIAMSGFWFDDNLTFWDPPADLEAFLSAGDPPVYIGFGSMTGRGMERLMAILLRAVHASGLRAVVCLGWSGASFPSTRNVFFADYVSHDWLFPRVSAVVHHGGAGTTAAGLRYGKPSLIIPFAGDQAFWGTRIFRLGCGPKPIPRSRLTVKRLTRALLDVHGNTAYHQSARSVMQALSHEHGLRTAADLIEKEITNW